MGLSNSQILLDSPNDTYHAGATVTGRLQFRLDKPKKVRAVECHFRGRAKTSWQESSGTSNNNSKTRYTATEEIFSNKTNLFEAPDSEIELAPADYDYPFSFRLPPNIPPSFEGKHGNIRYSVKATLDRPWNLDQNVKKVFTVFTPVDLRDNQKAKEPAQLQVEKYFCYFWCKSGPLTMVVNIPISGFVPGENIPFSLEVDNASNVRINSVSVKLVEVLKLVAHSPRTKERTENEDTSKLVLDAVEARRSRTFTQQIAVPATYICNIDQCSIINRSYALQVTAKTSRCHSNLRGAVPIFLGTVPIHQSTAFSQLIHQFPAFPPPEVSALIPSAPPDGGNLSVGFITNPGLTGDMFPTFHKFS